MLELDMNIYNDSAPSCWLIIGVDGGFIGYLNYGFTGAIIGGIIGFGAAILGEIACDHGPNGINVIINMGI